MPENSSTLDERWRALGSPWRPGMRSGCGWLCLGSAGMGWYWWSPLPPTMRRTEASAIGNRLPLWTDHGTLGALLGLVRERYGDPHLVVLPVFEGRRLSCWACVYSKAPPGFPANGDTEAEALIAALEAHDAND